MAPGKALAFTAETLKVHTCARPTEEVLFSALSTWELLNLPVDVVLGLPEQLERQCGVTPDFLADALKEFLVQEVGKDVLMRMYDIEEPQYLISATKHYSWPKAAGASRRVTHN